ncbi:MAG: hypothetical protein ACTSO9_07460 [Candidatus Helarchaeota archaeon]
MLKKIKGTIEKIKEELDPRREKFRKEVLNRGIFNLELFAQDMGLVVEDVKEELENLIKEERLKGYFTFGGTEFATYDYIKEHLTERMMDEFKLDLKKICEDYGVTLQVIHEVIDELSRAGKIYGFFDIPKNNTFFVLTAEEQKEFIAKLKKDRIHISELAEFIDDFIESKEGIDIDSLISNIQETEEESDLNDWELLAKDAIGATLGKKRAMIWIENLKSWNKIRGNFTEDQEYFIPQDIITKEISNFINNSGRVQVSEIQKRLGIKDLATLKTNLRILEKNRVIKGFFVSDESEYATEDRLLEEIKTFIDSKKQDIIEIADIQKEIGLDQRNTAALIRKLIRENKISGLISADSSKFFTYGLLNKTIMNYIENNDRIKLKEINENFKLLYDDLINHIETLKSRYNLRIVFTWDKSEIIKEEKMLYILMDILKKSKKSLLTEVGKASKLEVKQVIRLIKYMLEFGLIKGKLTNKEFIFQ